MKTVKELWLLSVVSAVAVLAGCMSPRPADGEKQTPLAEVTGVVHKGEKSIKPFLILDGSNERCYVSGKPLAKVESGARVRVKGVFRSYVFDSTGTDWTRPGAPAPPPLLKGWVVYLDVKELRIIQELFGDR